MKMMMFLFMFLMNSSGQAEPLVITNPTLSFGTDAINPAGRTLIAASSSIDESELEAVEGLRAIHDFGFPGSCIVTNEYVFDLQSVGAVDTRLTYSGKPAGTVATTSGAYATSYPAALRFQGALNNPVGLRIDFGTWLEGRFVCDQEVEAAGFTICTSAHTPETVTLDINYYSQSDVLLSHQTITTTNVLSYYHTAWKADSAPIAYIEISYDVDDWGPVITVDDLAYTVFPFVWSDPSLVSGEIDPSGGTAIKTEAVGAVPQATLEALSEFEVLQEWAPGLAWASDGLGTNQAGIVSFLDSSFPDLQVRLTGQVGSLSGNRISNSSWATSASTSLRAVDLGDSLASDYSIRIDFGDWNDFGFDQTVHSVRAAGFTLSSASGSRWQNVEELLVTFLDVAGNGISTQTLSSAGWDALRLNTYSGAAYFGYQSSYTNISSIRIDIRSKSAAILGLDDLGFTASSDSFVQSFAGKVDQLRGLTGDDDLDRLTQLLDDAVLLADEPIWGRAQSLADVTNGLPVVRNGVTMKFFDNSPKYFKNTDLLGEDCALMYLLACNDISLSDMVYFELPYMAAAYRLTGNLALRDRLLLQLEEMCSWVPFQRPGWTLPYTSSPSTNVQDGVFVTTGVMIQALDLALNILPAEIFEGTGDLRDQINTRLAGEVAQIHQDWTNEVLNVVKTDKYQSNQWIIPLSGMAIGAAYLGMDTQQDSFDYAAGRLKLSLDQNGEDGSLSEGYGYGLSRTTSSLFLYKNCVERIGDDRLAGYSCYSNLPAWSAMCFQPNGHVVNPFDWYEGQQDNGVEELQDIFEELSVVSGDDISGALLNMFYDEPLPTVFGMLSLGQASAAVALPLYGLFERSKMFVWRDSWGSDAGCGLWMRGGDSLDAHDHWDRGHVNWIVDGDAVLIEAGTPGYASTNKLSGYDSVVGHNVLQIGTDLFPTKGNAGLTEGANISSNGGSVSFATGEVSGSAYYPVEWSRDVDWSVSDGMDRTLAVTDLVTSASATSLTFRWHLATEVTPTISEDPNTHIVTVTVPAGTMQLGSDLVNSKAVSITITPSTDLSVTSVLRYDHTLKHNLTAHEHTTLEVTTESPVTSLSVITEFSVSP